MSEVNTVQTVVTPTDQVEAAPSAEPAAADAVMETEAYKAMKAETGPDSRLYEVPGRDRSFRVVDNLPGIVILDLGLAADPSATQTEQLRALREFIKCAIHPDDQAAFEVFLRNARPTIYIEELNQIVEGLLAVIGGRPTE